MDLADLIRILRFYPGMSDSCFGYRGTIYVRYRWLGWMCQDVLFVGSFREGDLHFEGGFGFDG